MKRKTTLLLMVFILGSTIAFAQNRNPRRAPRRDRISKTINPENRAQHMTDRMTYDYVLTDKQKKEVLKLNKEWIEKTTAQSLKYNLNKKTKDSISQVRRFSSLSGAERDAFQNERIKLIDNYDAQLKKILSKEQYAKHEKRFDSRYKNRSHEHFNKKRQY